MCNECQTLKAKKTKLKATTSTITNDGSYDAICGVENALGRVAKSSTTCDTLPPKYDRNVVRKERYHLQEIISKIFIREGQKLGLRYADNYHRTAQCLRKPIASDVSINRSKTHNVAFYGGLQQCASPACPVCTAKLQERRRLEIAEGFRYAYEIADNKKIIMVTFTFPHAISDRLKEQQAKLSLALKKLRQGNSYSLMKHRIGYEGLIRSLEVMWGVNGWHSHTHEAWIVDANTDVEALREWLTKRWFNNCIKSGLIPEGYAKTDSFNAHAVQVMDNCKSSDYLAKHDGGYWGADRELAKASSKGTIHSDKKTIHPFDLIRLYDETNDEKYAELFIEYANGIKGKSLVYWSQGLKDKAGIADKTDQEIVEEQEEKSDLLMRISYADWKLVVKGKARVKILDLVESAGIVDVFEYLEVLRE